MQWTMAPVFFCDKDLRIIMPETAGNLVIASGEANDELTLLDVLDHVLNKGVMIRGNLIISLAGVDLVYVGLDILLTSIETALRHTHNPPPPAPPAARNSEIE